ncbi:leucine--tRNA ligase [Mucilaginibacter sp. X5P1]|uniref:leucine--tRNA ligase n=1 Tax=Mucilaginibacter sp. X5P1 TaxID=2723088 RepID=UPI0016155275|nr:class I tRNA ligase family protein [Mucilaginibacter sp. X5P1]MBB6141886.1 leucyl-tRNA synthetase [Mucilaginibacter sp. X5P1]
MDYQFKDIEQKWQLFWAENQTFKAEDNSTKPKYYVLDMFPYPSGAGLHVGHPLGYIASDIFARYKRLKGFNVLHPMGYDSFGLPAEQYAIQTGQHPALTTEANIATYRRQLDQIGFSFDWSREVRTSSPGYYKWTQWIFMQLFNSWYNKTADKAEGIDKLIAHFEQNGSAGINAVSDEEVLSFSADEWKALSHDEQQAELLKYRITYLRESTVNWCPALGTVLANDEVKDGFSERGGYPVEQKKMMQWSMRITAYAQRLLEGLDKIDWPEPLKEMQRNWIGKSVGASVRFPIDKSAHNAQLAIDYIEVFTTRVDTIFGVTLLVIAPEHELVASLTTPEQKGAIDAYIAQTKKKSELDRMADTKTVSGAFTGSYVLNPLNNEKVPIWIADYVLAGYGTGAVMAVPSGDQRDYLFAKHFDLPIVPIMDIQNIEIEADPTKDGLYINSDFINGLTYKEATAAVIAKLEELGAGKAKVNFRMRDAIFGRQRYWGEPVPVYFKDGLPYLIDESDLPLVLPEVDKYLPTESGEPPLGRATDWKYKGISEYELSTMPGWAGSSWYWYRYMDANNDKEFASEAAVKYWKDVDLYIGGSEHATGHLLYSRFWNKFLKDIGVVFEEEPFKKLINQGMIQGRSNFVYRLVKTDKFVSKNIFKNLLEYASLIKKGQVIQLFEDDINYDKLYNDNVYNEDDKTYFNYNGELLIQNLHVDVNIVTNDILDIQKFKKWRPEFTNSEFILEDGKYICGVEVEKMSKSKFNVVNPDDIIERYGADTLRMYEMFLGPLEQSKPWNTNGIEGVFKFLRKFWRLFHNDQWQFSVSGAEPSKAELKSLHKIIRKVEEDIDRFSFNTSVSSFMIAVNELTDLKSSNKAILQDMVVILSPYAPHICEELWTLLGNAAGTLSYAAYPKFNPSYLVEDEFAYPISINGKTKMNLNISLSLAPAEIEAFVLANADVQKYLDGKAPKKVIVVKGRIVNMVV